MGSTGRIPVCFSSSRVYMPVVVLMLALHAYLVYLSRHLLALMSGIASVGIAVNIAFLLSFGHTGPNVGTLPLALFLFLNFYFFY